MDRKAILKQIKELIKFSSEQKFKDAKLIDNETIVQVEGETFEVGKQLSLVTPEGFVPAPAGEHTTTEGEKITVDEAGIITNVEVVEVAPEGEPTPAEQALADEVSAEDFYSWDQCMLDMMDEYDDEQIASAVCGKIKADGYIMTKENAFAEAATLVEETKDETKVEEVSTEEMGKKLEKMEARIAEVEKMMNEVLPMMKQTAEFSNSVLGKLDTFVSETPAELQFSSLKTEYKQLVKENKETKFSGLENIKNIRSKK